MQAFLKLKYFIAVAVVAILFLSSCTKDKPYVIMLSLDGFRWDYASMVETPNIDRLAKEGSHASSLQPSYPSKTFPNHYSMATGLYPDHHGIVQNNFYDTVLDRAFRLGNQEAVRDSIFWGGEPIWATAEKQNVRSASFFWVGTETNGQYQPSIRKLYDESVLFENRMDSVISWLHLPEDQRPHLILFYYHQPDSVGHTFGPESAETIEVIKDLDHYVGSFLSKLELAEKELNIEVNFILTSDHGMGTIKEGQYVYLEDVVDLDSFERVYGGNPVYLLTPKADYREKAQALLSGNENIKVFSKENLPEHYHYGTNPRIEELIVEANKGWGIALHRGRKGYSFGTHGYDPLNTDMHGIFYAKGPAFKKGYTHSTFENVSIYPLIANILGLEPAETDGTLTEVQGLLRR